MTGSSVHPSSFKLHPYQDVPGFCKSATTAEIAAHGHVLTPGRYVGAEEVEDDGDPFEETMPRLVAELHAQFAPLGLRKEGWVMAGEASTAEAATYPRGVSRDTDWKWPMVPARKLVRLNYERALKADTRSPGQVPVFGTNGRCG